jgi:hypothetical protein
MNPKLAIEVRQLQISGRSAWNKRPEKDLGRHFETMSDENPRSLADPIIQSLPLSTDMRKYLLAGVALQLEDSEIACIAAICPSLEVLDLPAFRLLRNSSLMRMAAALYRVTSKTHVANGQLARESNGTAADRINVNRVPLSQIREISLTGGIGPYKITVGEALPLFNLPKLETFQANNVWIRSDPPFSAIPTGQFRLRALSMTECQFGGVDLFHLLRSCSNLHTLSMYGCYTSSLDRPGFFEIGWALKQWGGRLQNLTLAPSDQLHDAVAQPLGEIWNLRCLRVLSVPWSALFGQINRATDTSSLESLLRSIVYLLPKGLERLDILPYVIDEYITDFSPAILELWMDHRFANLQQISVDRHAWTEKLLRMPIWDCSESTPTRVVLKRSV